MGEIQRREILGRKEIQDRIDQMWSKLFPRETPDDFQYPVQRITEELIHRGWLELITNQSLPYDENGSQTYGLFSITPDYTPKHAIYIHRSIKPDNPRYDSTLAHEIGHFLLHSKIQGGGVISTIPFAPNDVAAKRFGRMAFFSDRQWVEWQANEVMLALRLPENGLLSRVIKIQRELGILKRGLIRIDHQQCNQEDSDEVISRIAFDVMIQRPLVKARLRYLGIIQDFIKQESSTPSPFPVRSAGEILSSSASYGERPFNFLTARTNLNPQIDSRLDRARATH